MGLIRDVVYVGMLGLAFYGGGKYQEHKMSQSPAPMVQRLTIEDAVKFLGRQDPKDVYRAIERLERKVDYAPSK